MTRTTHIINQIPDSHQLVLINLDKLDELCVTVNTKHGSGYLWSMETPDNNFYLIKGEHIPPTGEGVGDNGKNVYNIQAIGSGRLILKNQRPFEKDKEPLETIEVVVTVSEE